MFNTLNIAVFLNNILSISYHALECRKMTAVSQSFATNIAPIIEKNINPHKIQQFNTMVRKFFDRHSDIMADTALYNVPYFTKEEGNMIYVITGLSEPIMRNAISQSKAIEYRDWENIY